MQELESVYKFYREIASLGKGTILKTDCYNELFKDCLVTKMKGSIFIVEINRDYVLEFHKKYPEYNCILGDVKYLPFKDYFFDWIFDFSTIDHITDYRKALEEYFRVLKYAGRLALFVWLSKDEEIVGEQIYFSQEEFENELRKKFIFLEEKEIFFLEGRKIKYYLLSKSGRIAI